jgi:aspartate/methionine/tyrosine aminotransferase
MPIEPFLLERYFALYEFKAKYLLSSSDCESLQMAELVEMASPESRDMWARLKLGYTESQGHPRLREAVAGLYAQVPPENVLIAAPEELIFIAMQTLLEAGDQVIAIWPAYQSLHELGRSKDCQVTRWEVRLGGAGWTLDLDELKRNINAHTRMIIINFPHNPTGFLPKVADLQAIIELARDHGLYLFSDEMYRLLEQDPARRLPAVCDLYEKGISLSGLSKTFSLPGLRIGWLATQQKDLLERWITYHDYTTICNSAPSEILAIMALQGQERIIRQNLGIIRDNIVAVEALFSRHPRNFAWFPPEAGSVAFPQWKGKGSVEQFCQDLLDAEGVMVVPGNLFGIQGNHFRLGLGRRNLPEGLMKVDQFLKGH